MSSVSRFRSPRTAARLPQERWNAEYRERPVETPNFADPVLCAALEYFGEVRGRTLLDLGCGAGAATLFFAHHGAQVTSVDASPVAIDNLRGFCSDHGIGNVTPLQMNAQDVASLGPFDLVFGSLVLHHIEPFAEFARVLRASVAPGGKAFFFENNAASSLLIWFREHVVGRWWVPKRGDADEFPLTLQEINALRGFFQVEVIYPELFFFRLVSDYLLQGRLRPPFVALDRLAYAIPALRKYSYRQYLLLSPCIVGVRDAPCG